MVCLDRIASVNSYVVVKGTLPNGGNGSLALNTTTPLS